MRMVRIPLRSGGEVFINPEKVISVREDGDGGSKVFVEGDEEWVSGMSVENVLALLRRSRGRRRT